MKLLLVVLGIVIVQASSDKVLLTVYYESKCSDSRDFIVDQLVPTVRKLKDYVQVRLVPFGKAASINKDIGLFECQHGPSECLGNKVQECALQFSQERSDEAMLDYVQCEMQTMAGTFGNLECVEAAKIPRESVENCMESNFGNELQQFSEYLTNLIKPKYVPTVTINGHFDQRFQDASQVNLFGTMCNYLQDAEPCLYHNNTS